MSASTQLCSGPAWHYLLGLSPLRIAFVHPFSPSSTLPPFTGSETPSRTSWGHFFVRESARHPLILTAEAQIEALLNSAELRGGYGPLAKVEAIQGACAAAAACAGALVSGTPDTPETRWLRLLCCLHVAWERDRSHTQSLAQHGCAFCVLRNALHLTDCAQPCTTPS